MTCPECGREGVSDKANACPSCAFPISRNLVNTDSVTGGESTIVNTGNSDQLAQTIATPIQAPLSNSQQTSKALFSSYENSSNFPEATKSLFSSFEENPNLFAEADIEPESNEKLFAKWTQNAAIAFFVYFIASALIAFLIAPTSRQQGGAVTFCMLIMIIYCMATERGRWGIFKKIGFVIVCYILQAILAVAWGLIAYAALIYIGVVDRFASFIAYFTSTLPFVIFAMRQSHRFMEFKPQS